MMPHKSNFAVTFCVYKHKWEKCGVVMSSGCNTLSIYSPAEVKNAGRAWKYFCGLCVCIDRKGRTHLFDLCRPQAMHVQRATKTSASYEFFSAAGNLLKCCRGIEMIVRLNFSFLKITLKIAKIPRMMATIIMLL
jgi:hypothetical protein